MEQNEHIGKTNAHHYNKIEQFRENRIENVDIHNMYDIIMPPCIVAGQRINEYAFNIENTAWKSKDDPVTNLDKEVEKFLKDSISKKITANFYGEEYGEKQNGASIDIYIDPIDGTKSFVKGEFLSSISVAVEKKGELVFSVVYDFMRDIAYYANPDGAFLSRSNWNDSDKTSPIKPIALPRIDIPSFSKNAIIYTDEGKYINLFPEASKRHQVGSVALAMAQVAAGVHQGLIASPYQKDGQNDICDIAAGYYLLKQAGLVVKDYNLDEYNYKKPSNGIIAMTPKLFGELELKIAGQK